MNDKEEKLFDRTRKWTLFLAVISVIFVLFQTLSLMGLLSTKKLVDQGETSYFTAEQLAAVKETITAFNLGILVVQALIYLGAAIFFIMYLGKLRRKTLVNKIPYFLYLIPVIYGFISLLMGGSLQSPITLISLVIDVLICVPAILAIRNLFVLEPDSH